MEYIAHIREDGKIQTVREHLEGTAALAGRFAKAFDAESAGYAAGMLHDIGKYSRDFQDRIRGGSISVDHSTAGAQIAAGKNMIPVAFAVAGHHSGLPDGGSKVDSPGSGTLFGRIRKPVPDYQAYLQEIALSSAEFPGWLFRAGNFTQSFFTRMLFSCLVDADYLDTERFMQGEQPRGGTASLEALLNRLRGRTDAWLNAERPHALNKSRNEVLRACIACGRSHSRGLYTLTVPTGGGKTIASLSFALEQAVRLNMARVIYVIPYTSIIDQTVDVFSEILGAENVLAHYAGAEWQLSEDQAADAINERRALAAENWDAPIIVTTAVQFFESLFANRSSRCRKLHNIADSVILFDEAQTLPSSYLKPCVASIAELVKHYRVSAVLCTATQPELQPLFQQYDLKAEEICPNRLQLFQNLKRTVVKDLGTISRDALTERLAGHDQVLCVVNRRALAQEFYSALPGDGKFCLTTLLCPADRKAQLDEIRRRLRNGEPCRVISTSLIEAGVDVDFPVAYREEAGLDSVLQTAGRCNREGQEKNPENRPVYLFKLEGVKPLQALRPSVSAMREVQSRHMELDAPQAVEVYFRAYNKIRREVGMDEKGILEAIEKGKNGKIFPFEEVAKEFRLIESAARTIYIPIDQGEALCKRLRGGERSRTLFRKLGEYSVGIYEQDYGRLFEAGMLETIDDWNAVLTDLSVYDRKTGLYASVSGGRALFAD